MDTEILRVIEEIQGRGNTAEVKKRKEDVVVLEVIRKIAYSSGR